jgi:hypothetical protein
MSTKRYPDWYTTSTLDGTTGALTPAVPAHNPGDLLIMYAETANQNIAFSANAAGWTQLYQAGTGTAGGTAATRLGIFWVIPKTNTTAGPTITDPGDHVMARVARILGPYNFTDTPLTLLNSGVVAAATTAVTLGSGVTTLDLCRVVQVGTHATDVSTAQFTPGTNADLDSNTEYMDSSVIDGNGGGIFGMMGNKAVAGSFAAMTGGSLLTASVQSWAVFQIAPVESERPAMEVGFGALDFLGGAEGFEAPSLKGGSFPSDLVVAGNAVPVYRMRGKIAGNFVYWNSAGIDASGAQYPGGGTPTNIVVAKGPMYS